MKMNVTFHANNSYCLFCYLQLTVFIDRIPVIQTLFHCVNETAVINEFIHSFSLHVKWYLATQDMQHSKAENCADCHPRSIASPNSIDTVRTLCEISGNSLMGQHPQQAIHRHQTPPLYHHVIYRRLCTCQPPPFGVAPITAKRDVIHKTGST